MREEDARGGVGVTPALGCESRHIRLFHLCAGLLFGFSLTEESWRRVRPG